jgi:hypothetical protein
MHRSATIAALTASPGEVTGGSCSTAKNRAYRFPRAEVHLTAYKQRTTPIVHGDIFQVSADRLTDNKTNNPYYTALVRVDENELAELPHIRLYPGMPATVIIPTVERTALDYLIGPLVMSFNHAFRQR